MGRAFPSVLLQEPVANPVSPAVSRRGSRVVFRFGLALIAAAAGIAAANLAGGSNQFATCLPLLAAVALTAWFSGVAPALLCQAAAVAFVYRQIVGSTSPLSVAMADLSGPLLYVAVGTLVLFLTASLRWNRDLRGNEQSLRLIAATTNDCIWDWNLKSGRVSRSGNLSGIFGYSENADDISWWRDRLHPEDRETVWNGLQQSIAGSTSRWRAEYRFRQKDGSYILLADKGTLMRDRGGKAFRLIGGMSDITAQRKAEERIAYDALHDSLTGMPNRQLFRERLEQTLKSNGEGGLAAVLFLDFDRFKTINDSLGHPAGDRVLRNLCKRIELSLQSGEMASRFGGDEFTVLLESLSGIADAEAAARRILESLSVPYEIEGHSLVVYASIGIALAEAGMYPEEILRHAHVAMYRAKNKGRGRYEIFQPALDAQNMNVLQRESDMRKGLAAGEFRMYYQPIVAFASGRLTGLEALLRWQHPRRGLLLPAEFLPLAEESGLIVELDHWALKTACEDLNYLRETVPGTERLTVSVNLSEKQFTAIDLLPLVGGLLTANRLDGTALIFELTENIILEHDNAAAATLQRLKDLGIGIAIDDFGKGHSSFGRLQDLPISVLKIDGAFVERIRKGKPEIVDAIIALASQLKLDVTAECVETREQFLHLRHARCTTGQGLYFSAALSVSGVAELLRGQGNWTSEVSPPPLDFEPSGV